MAAIAAFVVAFTLENAPSGTYRVWVDYVVDGQAGTRPYRTELNVSWSATPAEVNAAILTAAVNAAQAEGFTIGDADVRTLAAGAIGLGPV